MAKRLLSLFLAAVMVLGMIPATYMTAAAAETTAPAALWSADFDDADTVYTGSAAESIWSTFYLNGYLLDVKSEESGNKYMSVVPNSETTNTDAFNMTSDVFTATNETWITFDIRRSAADKDCLYFTVLDESGKYPLAQIHIRYTDGKISYKRDYFEDKGTDWQFTNTCIPAGWQTVRVFVKQSAEAGADVLKIYLGDTLAADVTGTFSQTDAGASKISFGCPGNYKGAFVELGIDNVGVYAYNPVMAASFADSAYALNKGKTVQTAVVTTPAAPMPGVKITYASDNESVATVSDKGEVTGVADGTANITATVTDIAGNTATATAAVTVSTPIVPVAPAVSAPLWSADFDNADKVYTDNTSANSVWTTYTTGDYILNLAGETGERHMAITVDPEKEAKAPNTFTLTSKTFGPTASVAVTLDLSRADAAKDGVYIYVCDESGSYIAWLICWPSNGRLQYRLESFADNGTNWSSDSVAVGKGWSTIRILVEQSETDGADTLKVYAGDTLALEKTGTFMNSKNPAKLMVSSITGWGSYMEQLLLDDLAVYSYVPAKEVTLDKEAATLNVQDTLQLNATVLSNASCITAVEWTSANDKAATVDQTGKVTAVGGGETTVTVTVTNADGSKVTDSCAITVNTPIVPVAPVVSTPVWSADFDDPSKVYTGTGENSVWSSYNTNAFSITVKEDNAGGNKYMQLTDGNAGVSGSAFVLRSKFDSMNAAVVTLDVYRNAANKDGFRILFQASEGGTTTNFAEILIWYSSGRIDYSFSVEGSDRHNSGMTLSAGQWETLTCAIIQSAEAGKDQIIVSYDGQIKTFYGTFSKSDAGVSQVEIAGGGGGWNTVTEDLRFDNLAVYPYIPATEVTLDKESVTLEIGQTEQLAATVASNATCITSVSWKSSNKNVATVDANGKITAVGGGIATVTVIVTNADGSKVTDSVEVTVPYDGAAPLWRADFDNEGFVYTDSTSEDTVWSVYNANDYILSLAGTQTNKYMSIVLNPEATASSPFALTSTAFAPTASVVWEFDVSRGETDKDCFYLYVLDEKGSAIAWLFCHPDVGGLCYRREYFDGDETNWSSRYGSLGKGWKTVRIIVQQSANEGEDVLKVYIGDALVLEQTGTFTNSNLPAKIAINAVNGYGPHMKSLCLDNMAVYPYVPVTGLSFANDSYAVNGGESVQLEVNAAPKNAAPVILKYASSDNTVAHVNADGVVTGILPGEATITVTEAGGATAQTTVTVTGYGDVTVWEEDFEDWDIGSNGGFNIRNEKPALGSIQVEDATAVGGDGKAIVLRRTPDETKFLMRAVRELPDAVEQLVFEYDVLDAQGGHGNMRMPMTTSNGEEGGRQIAIFLQNGNVYYNVGSNTPTQMLGTTDWRHMKLIMNTKTGVWSLWMDGELLGSGTNLLNSDPVKYIYFQAAYENKDVTKGLWYDNFKVSLYVPAQSVEIAGEAITINGHETYQMTTNLTPIKANDQLLYTSSDPSVVTVDGNGLLTGIKEGTATITVKVSETVQDTITVTVKPVAPEQIEINVEDALSLPVGAHTFLQATVKPDNALPKTVTFASSDTSIITVDEYGEIICLKAGTATVTAACGNVSKSVSITVGDPTVMETIQVSPNGTSIADALAEIAAINATEKKMTGNIEVVLADGYYYITETIQMSEIHGGTNGYSVIWKAAKGATPIISGGKYFSGSLFADENGDGIYTIDLSTLNIPKVADPNTMATTRQLFVNNVRATRARSEGGLTDASYYMSGSTNLGHVSKDEYLAGFARIQDLEFVYQELWTNPRAGVSSIVKNGDGTVNITMDRPGWSFASNKGASSCGSDGPRWIENALELLDQPGEWYLNEETQILYYMPRAWEDMEEATFMLPLLDDYDPNGGITGLMYIAGTDYDKMVNNIRFEGITFADTTWTRPSTANGHSDAQNNHIRERTDYLPDAAITVTKANSVSFIGCTFTRLGITAVKMVKGVQNSHFVGNHFYDISGGAINIGDPATGDENNTNPSDYRMMMKNCDVLNNYIHNIGVDFNSSAAISLGFGPDMDFSYNEIFNMPYSGYHIGYGWQSRFENNLKNLVISNNFIHDFMGDGVADGGGVYTLGNSGGDDDHYNKIHSNYIKTVLDVAGPLYCDEGSTYYELYNNLVDLSKVTDWKGNTNLSWLQMNAASHHLKVHDNFATVSKYHWNSDGSEVENAQLEDPNNWSTGAQAVIDGAGLQSAYSHLRNGHAELIVVNMGDGVDMNVGDTFQLEVSYTDGKDQPVSGGNYILSFDTKDPSVATVDASGKITAKAKGTTTVRIWVVSNDVLDIVERTIYIEDEIETVKLENYEDKNTLSMSDQADGILLKAFVETKQGRTMTPAAAQVTFTVADESVAKLENGVLVPVGVGSTTLTVKVDMDDMTGETTYKVEITLAKTFTVDYLEDLFNSKKIDWTISGTTGKWEQVEDTSLTTKIHGWTTYGGRTFENELLTFKLKLDITQTGGWPCIVIRADSATVNTAGGGASGYVLCFGGTSKAGTIELQRWNGKTRTMIIGSVDNLEPLTGIYNLPHGIDDGEEHLIQFGALTDGGKTRLVLYIDGVKKIDFMDDCEDAIVAPGYFGIIGRNEVYYLSHASEKDSYLSAAIGGEMYNSLEEALAVAKDGDNVRMLADAKVGGIIMKQGVGLDLNGQTLKADYLVAFAGSQIRDSVGGGVVQCENVRLAADNEQLPVWDQDAGGYRFFEMLDQRKMASQDANGFVFYAKPALGTEANNGLMAKINSNQLSFKIRMRWSNAGSEVEQLFSVKEETVASTYSQSGQVIMLTVSGAGSYAGKLLVDVYLESETGVIWTSKDLTYKGQ